MKKIFVTALTFLAFIVTPVGFAFAQTVNLSNNFGLSSTATQQERFLIIDQELLSLYQQLQVLITLLNNQENSIGGGQTAGGNGSGVTSNSATLFVPSPVLGDVSPSVPEQPIREEAEIDIGSGFQRGADLQNPNIKTAPGQTINGELTFLCFYVSGPGQCAVTPDSTSSLPQIALAQLTIQFNEAGSSCVNNVPTAVNQQVVQTVTTDENGNFSFTAPGDPYMQSYIVTIENSGQSVFWANLGNSAALPVSGVCAASGN